MGRRGGESSGELSNEKHRFQVQLAGFESPSLPLSSCVTLGELLNLLEPQFHHLLNGDNNSFCLLEFVVRIK